MALVVLATPPLKLARVIITIRSIWMLLVYHPSENLHLLICQKLYWQQYENIYFRQVENTLSQKKDLSESELEFCWDFSTAPLLGVDLGTLTRSAR